MGFLFLISSLGPWAVVVVGCLICFLQELQAIATAFGYIPELEGKFLLLKTTCLLLSQKT